MIIADHLDGGPEAVVSISITDIYTSQNGDNWWLVRDAEAGTAIVRHEANLASGGNVARIGSCAEEAVAARESAKIIPTVPRNARQRRTMRIGVIDDNGAAESRK